MQLIATKVVEGVLNKTIETKNNTTYYRVVAGSYTNKDSAIKLVEELKEKGYNAFVSVYNK